MGKKEAKTNAIRILETMKIPYEAMTYECKEFVDGSHIADQLGLDHSRVYKTITTVGKSGGYYVFVLPIDEEIDFKEGGESRRGEVSGDAAAKRPDESNRLRAGRLYLHRHEESSTPPLFRLPPAIWIR